MKRDNLPEPDEAIFRLARAIARQAAREDHARELAQRQARHDQSCGQTESSAPDGQQVTTHTFTITASGPHPQADDFETRFLAAGCDDATIAFQGSRIVLDFDREAPTFAEALASAVRDVERAGGIVESTSA